jgi:hypothetical protein
MGAPRSRPPLDPNMLCEYPNNVSFHARGLIEQVGGYSFDGVAIGQKLRLPRDALRTSYPCEIVHRGVADLTLDRFAIVQHRKCERQPLVVVSHNLATRQRHRNPHPRNSASGSRHMRTISPDGCARAAIGRVATPPALTPGNSHRLMPPSCSRDGILTAQLNFTEGVKTGRREPGVGDRRQIAVVRRRLCQPALAEGSARRRPQRRALLITCCRILGRRDRCFRRVIDGWLVSRTTEEPPCVSPSSAPAISA